MKSNFLLTILIIVILTFTGCDCSFDYQFDVINETTDTINISYYQKLEHLNIVILPNMKKTIAVTNGQYRGCVYGKAHKMTSLDSTINYYLDNIEISKNDTIKSNTNYNYEKNWVFESSKNIGKYIANVKNSDF